MSGTGSIPKKVNFPFFSSGADLSPFSSMRMFLLLMNRSGQRNDGVTYNNLLFLKLFLLS